jgi:hypothetical protein
MKNDESTCPQQLLEGTVNKSVVIFNKWVPIDEVANQLHTGYSSAYNIIYHKPNFRTVCARWVPKKLTAQHKHNLSNIRNNPLNQYHHTFSSCNDTGDKTWIHYNESESKCQSMEWKTPNIPIKKFQISTQQQEKLCSGIHRDQSLSIIRKEV